MTNPASESFWSSKSMQLIVFSAGFALLVLAVYIVVLVVFDKDIWQAALGVLGLRTAETTGGIARNIMTDAPVRQMYAQQQTNQLPPKGPFA